MNERAPLIIENAHIMYKNFAGERGQYNKDGDRSFCVRIDDPALADRLAHDGWNVKVSGPREEGDAETFYIPVAVSYDFRPPRISLFRGQRCYELSIDNIAELDAEVIISADVAINPSAWSVNGNSGIKAYLQRLCVVVEQDPFADKYADYIR